MPTFGSPITNLTQNVSMRPSSNGQFPIPDTSEGRREELMKTLADVENANQSINDRKKISEVNLQMFKTRLIQSLFKMMKDLGVDPTSLESINEFLQALDNQDPDLRELFEVSFNALINDQSVNPQASSPASAGETGGGLFNRPESLAQNAFQPR